MTVRDMLVGTVKDAVMMTATVAVLGALPIGVIIVWIHSLYVINPVLEALNVPYLVKYAVSMLTLVVLGSVVCTYLNHLLKRIEDGGAEGC